MEAMIAPHMPDGIVTSPIPTMSPERACRPHLGGLGLTCHIELFAITLRGEHRPKDICPLFRDVFQFHWRDECQHVVLMNSSGKMNTQHFRLPSAIWRSTI
jgi:hypothetical protein